MADDDPTSTTRASLTSSTPGSRSTGRTTSHRRVAWWLRLVSLCAGITCVPVPVLAQVNILTNRYDPQRTGANLIETTLTAGNVTAAGFGKLYSYPVDGAVYAQPLYVAGVTIDGVAQERALRRDDERQAVRVRRRPAVADAVVDARFHQAAVGHRRCRSPTLVAANLNIVGNVGIQSTPVIDLATATIYLVVRTKESGAYVQRLHALDIATGVVASREARSRSRDRSRERPRNRRWTRPAASSPSIRRCSRSAPGWHWRTAWF